MFKKMFARIFLERGLAAAEELIGKAVRHGLTWGGGVLTAHGLITGEQWEVIAAAVVTIVGGVLSAVRTFLDKRAA